MTTVTEDIVALPPRRGWALVWALSIGQLISWGSLYYSFSLFVEPMQAELGWSKTQLNGALSIGLVVAALLSIPVGSWIDRYGGFAMMVTGSICGGALLLVWSQVDTLWGFYVLWALIGVAQSATLYEPAFAVVTANLGKDYKRGILAVTLVGGFASTVFVPLTHWLIELLGWRDALVALAAMNLTICLGIHYGFLRGTLAGNASAPPPVAVDGRRISPLRRAVGSDRFWGLVVAFSCQNLVVAALIFHLVPMLTERGMSLATIVALYMLIGPMQVAGRVVLVVAGSRLDVPWMGRVCLLTLPVSIMLLAFADGHPWLVGAALTVYGLGNGVSTIVKGTAVPVLLGREGYGAVNGAIVMPSRMCHALAPFAAAAVWQLLGGYDEVLWVMTCVAALGAAAFWFAARGR